MQNVNTCQHYWLAEEPNGQPIVKAVCKKCGIRKQFPASIPDEVARKLVLERKLLGVKE